MAKSVNSPSVQGTEELTINSGDVMKKKYNRLSFIMDRELHKDFLMKCIKNDTTMTEVIKELVEGYVTSGVGVNSEAQTKPQAHSQK